MLIENLFLCAGAMKSGTTWLYGVLDRHPSIYFSYEKEIHYFAHLHTSQIRLDDRNRLARTKHALQNFDPDRASAAAMRHKLLWYGNYLSNPLDDSWYANLFSFRKGQKYCADFSNLYCHMHADGWNHVKAFAENVKVIYVMRNPVERLWSHIRFHLHYTGKFSNIQSWSRDDFQDFARQPFIWDNGEYTGTVARLRQNLGDHQLRVFFFEDIHRDHQGWLSQLEDFLDVPHFDFKADLLSRKVAESPQAPMPDFFPELFIEKFEEEYSGLTALGLSPAGLWHPRRMAL